VQPVATSARLTAAAATAAIRAFRPNIIVSPILVPM
jgi:hypothetical protein